MDVLKRFPRVREREQLHLECPPVPWVGRPIEARVLLLTLNPRFVDGASQLELTVPEFLNENLAALTFRTTVPAWCFDRRFEATGGFRYWAAKLRPLVEVVGWDKVANEVAWLEYFPYHSTDYRHVPAVLPSQRFNFDLLRDAIHEGKPIVVLRSWALWVNAVPELAHHPQTIEGRNPRSPMVSPGNLGEDGFRQVVTALLDD